MDHGDDSSFLHMTGLDRRSFQLLLDIIIPAGHKIRRRRKGRKWSLPPDGMLGLVLFFIGSGMNSKHICMLFGITPTVYSRIMKMMLPMIVRKLRFHHISRVKFPNEEKMQQFALMVQNREPSVDDVIGFMDGLSW